MDSSRMTVEGEVTIDVPRAQLFRLWRNVVNLPLLLSHIAAVERLATLGEIADTLREIFGEYK